MVLRKQHNPAFALACHLANTHQVTLIILAVVIDDAYLPCGGGTRSDGQPSASSSSKPVVFTARRIAFVLEALQEAARDWQSHGAGVAIRVHGPQSRTPHHLTLARRAMAVVTDEPFVHPYRAFVESMEKVVQQARVPLFSVDGSTTVPPVHLLKMKFLDFQGRVVYREVPNKAWKWDERTKSYRKDHVLGALSHGHLDAPDLVHKLTDGFFLRLQNSEESSICKSLPEEWKDRSNPSPGKRPWTATELGSILNLKDWVLKWPGIDASVPPCQQTHGSGKAGRERWQTFVAHHLEHYAQRRNSVTQPHAVSRMSCYLNYGVVSIFPMVQTVWDSKQGKSYKGASKFEDEVIKWREIGYVHAFASPEYNLPSAVPAWASQWISSFRRSDKKVISTPSYSLESLESGETKDETWNAMQLYLVQTGELHNNARMTWGKTLVHWQKYEGVEELLRQLVYLNDRYALDGLSPPSYAGLLWCLGWCDKPAGSGAISEKPASRYRTGKRGFQQAASCLLSSHSMAFTSTTTTTTTLTDPPTQKAARIKTTRGDDNTASKNKNKRQKSIRSFVVKQLSFS